MNLAAIPSPETSVWHLLGLPVRAYALCIVLGIVAAVLLMEHRLRSRGVAPWASLDMAVWAVPFGIVGARLYHLATSPQDYFGAGGHPLHAFYIWEGGLGIWGAVAGGAVGAWLAARQLGLPFSVFADTLAPALPVAQGIGRLGNYFNNELYGKVTTLPWGLQVHEMDRSNPGHATVVDGNPVLLPHLYHPTFLYEMIWNFGVAALVWALDRKYKFGRGRAFAVYVAAYTVGRFWIEILRVDEANHFFGIRLNVFTAIVLFIGAVIYLLVVKGPRTYVVPADAPQAYQVVSERRFVAYRETGILPPDTEADVELELAAAGDPVESDAAPNFAQPANDDDATVVPVEQVTEASSAAASEPVPDSAAGDSIAASTGADEADASSTRSSGEH